MVFKLSCKKEGENWWFGAVAEGIRMPVNSAKDHYVFDGSINLSYNQVCTLLVSDSGRYIYAEGGCKVKIGNDEVALYDPISPVDVGEGFSCLKEAYLAAAKKHFYHANTCVPSTLLLSPQYCSWVEMLRGIDQAQVENYVRGVKEAGLPEGVFILDDGWMKDYGDWDFVEARFPSPKAMCDEIHRLGFKVIMWTCPFVNPSASTFKELEALGAFVKNANGETAIRSWWSGKSAVLDMSNPVAWNYYKAKLDYLMQTYGVVCMK